LSMVVGSFCAGARVAGCGRFWWGVVASWWIVKTGHCGAFRGIWGASNSIHHGVTEDTEREAYSVEKERAST